MAGRDTIRQRVENMEKATAWHNSEAQKDVDAIRMKATDSLSFIVEGVAK
jgi:uncharacterized protein (DUF1330 family)